MPPSLEAVLNMPSERLRDGILSSILGCGLGRPTEKAEYLLVSANVHDAAATIGHFTRLFREEVRWISDCVMRHLKKAR